MENPGRLELTSAYKVNWLTIRISASASFGEIFIFPFSSSNMRKPQILSAIQRASFSVSLLWIPKRTNSPCPILPVSRPSIDTAAFFTLVTTALIFPPIPL